METVYVFFANGFEEIEALTPVDVLRRAGLKVEMVSITSEDVVIGAHGVSLTCDSLFEIVILVMHCFYFCRRHARCRQFVQTRRPE
jgi:putative intracellular protease/amidase